MSAPDLSTRYLGLELASPLVASASPLTGDLDNLQWLAAAGASAVVLPSLFEEQLEHEEWQVARLAELGSGNSGEAQSYFPELDTYNTGPDAYLELVRGAKKVLSIPVIASLNAQSLGGWAKFAERLEEAGADALELNLYHVPVDPNVSGAEVEQRYLDVVSLVRAQIAIPLAVKLAPVFSSLPHMARRLVECGADGLVLFNRLLNPDIDLERLRIVPRLELSTSAELRTPLQWIGILRDQVSVSLASSGGVHAPEDLVKLLLVGADVVQTTSSLLRRGPAHLTALTSELRAWMIEFDYTSVEQMKGSMCRDHCPNPAGFERQNYMRALTSYTSDLP